jgi:hypothetical protein
LIVIHEAWRAKAFALIILQALGVGSGQLLVLLVSSVLLGNSLEKADWMAPAMVLVCGVMPLFSL